MKKDISVNGKKETYPNGLVDIYCLKSDIYTNMGKNIKEELKRIHSITYGNINENVSKKIESLFNEQVSQEPNLTTEFFKILEDAAKTGGISQSKKGNYVYDRYVEAIQIALMLLGYKLPLHGADGKYGPETANAVATFKNNLMKLNEDASDLRDTLSDLGYEEKSGSLSSGGEISDSLSTIVSKILKDFKNTSPDVKIRITAGNDTFHKTLNYKSKHVEGNAIDLVLNPYNSNSSKAFTDILNKYKLNDNKFSFIDEYKNPSKQSTGGHFHLSYGGEGVPQSDTQTTVGPSQTKDGETMTPEMISKLIYILKLEGIDDSDLNQFTTKTLFVNDVTDVNFYKKLLETIGAPVTPENLKFLYAWRQSEGRGGKFNPFNTTLNMPGATNFNEVGVKNFSSLDDGLIATVKTLTNGRYKCILDGLRKDLGADVIAGCRMDLKTWGTGDLVAKVISGYNSGAQPNIPRLT